MSDENAAPTDSAHFPKMLYRPGSEIVIGAHTADVLIVNSDAEFNAATGDGWMTVDDFLDTDPEDAPVVGNDDALTDEHAEVTALLRDELLEADKKLQAEISRANTAEALLATANSTISTLRSEASTAKDRITALQTENAQLTEKLATLDKDGDGNPGGSLPNDPPALTGKTKAELLEIAAAEGVTVEAGSTNADIIAAIDLGRETAKTGE